MEHVGANAADIAIRRDLRYCPYSRTVWSVGPRGLQTSRREPTGLPTAARSVMAGVEMQWDRRDRWHKPAPASIMVEPPYVHNHRNIGPFAIPHGANAPPHHKDVHLYGGGSTTGVN